MSTKTYIIPELIIDAKEEKALTTLTETYNKMVAPSAVNKAMKKVGEKVPQVVKDTFAAAGGKISEAELFSKSMEVLGKSFQVLEQFAAKVTISENEILKQVNQISSNNKITKIDEICLVRSYELSKIVDRYKYADIIAAVLEGAATGAPGFAGIPFNLVLSTFLYYRAVQSVAMFYGYDIKNDPAELTIASEVFMNGLNPKATTGSELSGTIAKIMLLTETTTVRQVVKKGWVAMAEKNGVTLLLAQMRALANAAAKKALEKAGKQGLEKAAFSELFEQIGKKLTQKSIGKAIPYVGAVIGAAIDTAQMVQIIQYAQVFYGKRFILEKESRIYALDGTITTVVDADVSDDESTIGVVEEGTREAPAEKETSVSATSVMDEIMQAKQLLDAGILTEQEFADLKAKLIAKL